MKKNYNLFALLMVVAVIFWEAGLCSDGAGNHVGNLSALSDSSASYYTQAGNDIVDEPCTPEQIGLGAYHANAENIFYTKTSRGRNFPGKLLYALFAVLCSFRIAFSFFDIGSSDSGIVRNLSMVLIYMHDQDGKKRLH